MEMDIFQWGERIKRIRQSSGLSQAELAEKVGVSHTTMNRIEKGKSIPDMIMISNLSNLFDVSLTWLVTGEKKEGQKHLRGLAFPVYTESQLLSEENTPNDSTLWVRIPGLPDNCFLFKTYEQAMTPKIQAGDFVAVIKDEYTVGSTVLFTNNYGIILIRKLGKNSDGEEFFLAENTDYSPIKKTGDEKIFGKVVTGIRTYMV
ncbi:MAG: helix-turn-helix domain-containing protein [Bacteroidales bacterium]